MRGTFIPTTSPRLRSELTNTINIIRSVRAWWNQSLFRWDMRDTKLIDIHVEATAADYVSARSPAWRRGLQ